MEAATTSGFAMTVVGVTTVFLALTLLVVVLTVVARLLSPPHRSSAGAAAVATADSASVGSNAANSDATPGAESGDTEARLRAVALAAYGLHRRRRVVVRTPPDESAWRLGGRAAQMRRAWR